MDNDKVFAMDFRKVYGALVNKAQRKGRTQEEVDQVICWLTGYGDLSGLPEGLTYGDFFRNAPSVNPARCAVKGKVCGVQVETIEDPLMRDIRCLDKLVDDLAKGKPVDALLPEYGLRPIKPAEEAFFDGKPGALELYRAFRTKLFGELPDTQMRVQKTQITFTNPKVFACVSMVKLRKASERPAEYIVVTFGLGHEEHDPRIDVATEAHPNRWTHHVLVSGVGEIDDQLMGWVREAYAFSASK